jgi:hypothetical protein
MRKVAILMTLAAILALPAYAQTIPGTIGFDLVPGTPSFSGNAIVDADSDIDKALPVANGSTFKTLVRLNGAVNLVGVSFDFSFPKEKLNVKDIRETRADVDFSSVQSFNELTGIVNWFAANAGSGAQVNTFSYSYDDDQNAGTPNITTQPGVVIDVDGNGSFSFNELTNYINEFAANAAGSDVPFWTEFLSKNANRAGGPFQFNESVEVFDRVADINAAGAANDNTVVLLARPNDGRDAGGAIVPGYGFDGNAILFEVSFQALVGQSGDAAITISNAVGIDETFQSLSDVHPIQTVDTPSTVTIN